jgi:hypothetical protein
MGGEIDSIGTVMGPMKTLIFAVVLLYFCGAALGTEQTSSNDDGQLFRARFAAANLDSQMDSGSSKRNDDDDDSNPSDEPSVSSVLLALKQFCADYPRECHSGKCRIIRGDEFTLGSITSSFNQPSCFNQ